MFSTQTFDIPRSTAAASMRLQESLAAAMHLSLQPGTEREVSPGWTVIVSIPNSAAHSISDIISHTVASRIRGFNAPRSVLAIEVWMEKVIPDLA